MESARFKLNKIDLAKVAKGALIALGGALIVYVTETIPEIDFGEYTPIAVAVASVAVNAARRWLSDYSK